jgi:hypothetical protein
MMFQSLLLTAENVLLKGLRARCRFLAREFPGGALNRRAGCPRPSPGEGTRIISGMQRFNPYLLVFE